MLRKIFIGALLSTTCSITIAEPNVEVVSQIPSGTNFVMQPPSVDCRYDLDLATEVKTVEGIYILNRKPDKPRIHQYSCQMRFDNTKTLSEIAFWGAQSLTSLVNYPQCDLTIVTSNGVYGYDMTPVFVLGSYTMTQYKVTDFTNIPSNAWIYSGGFICTANEDVSSIAIDAIGIKYQ